MKSKRRIKNIILKSIGSGGCYARDLVVPVSIEYGKPVSIRKISAHLRVLYGDNEVRRVAEMKGSLLKRYKWFKIVDLWRNVDGC